MEFEHRVKIDPNRTQKVFTAQQVMEALLEAFTFQRNQITRQFKDNGYEGLPLSVELGMLEHNRIMRENLEKALGVEGPDGAYVDGGRKNDSSRGR
jgi:hypothetical protein